MIVVLDTNVIVSALWSGVGKPHHIWSKTVKGEFLPCFDYRIMEEYKRVISKDKFHFTKEEIYRTLKKLESKNLSFDPTPLKIKFKDETDKKFYEMACSCNCSLITGNKKHYPDNPLVVTPTEFLEDLTKAEAV
ncbi:MAG: putative toxin-antitoxin system toxin component, PIN family [Anaerovoracaceae bacterium]